MCWSDCVTQVVVSLQLITSWKHKWLHLVQATVYPKIKPMKIWVTNPKLSGWYNHCLLYMKIYCDSHFPVSSWLKCDKMQNRLSSGLNRVSVLFTERMVLVLAVARWKDEDVIVSKVWVQIAFFFFFFKIMKLSDFRNYSVSTDSPSAQRHICDFNIFVLYFMMLS